jgi:excisionase family DNA binding protein
VSVTVRLTVNGIPVDAVIDDDAVAAIAAAVGERDSAPGPAPSPYLTVQEAAEYLRTTRQAVDDMLSAGKLPRRKVGRRTLVARADLEALIERDPRRRR